MDISRKSIVVADLFFHLFLFFRLFFSGVRQEAACEAWAAVSAFHREKQMKKRLSRSSGIGLRFSKVLSPQNELPPFQRCFLKEAGLRRGTAPRSSLYRKTSKGAGICYVVDYNCVFKQFIEVAHSRKKVSTQVNASLKAVPSSG